MAPPKGKSNRTGSVTEETEEHVVSNQSDHALSINKLSTSLAELIKEIRELKSEIQNLKIDVKNEIQEIKKTLDNRTKEINQLKNENDELKKGLNELERHNRSWNLIWINKENETKDENCDEMARKFLELLPSVKARGIMVNVSHRIGRPKPDSPRPIIIRLVSKSDVWFILKKKQEYRTLNRGFIFQDLTKIDRAVKQKYSQEISELVNTGQHRARFEKGQWIVDGKPYLTKSKY